MALLKEWTFWPVKNPDGFEARAFYRSDGQMVAAREARHLAVKASDWCAAHGVQGRRSQMSWMVMQWPESLGRDQGRTAIHIDVILPDRIVLRIPAGFATAPSEVRREELIRCAVATHRELCFLADSALGRLEAFLRDGYGSYARVQEFGRAKGPRFRVAAAVRLDGLCHVLVDVAVGPDWHRIEPESIQAADATLMRGGMKAVRVQGDSLVLRTPWGGASFARADASTKPSHPLQVTAIVVDRAGVLDAAPPAPSLAARQGHPAYLAHFTAPFYDDEASELAPFGSDEGSELWAQWRPRSEELGPASTVRDLLAVDCGGPEQVDDFLAQLDREDDTDTATIVVAVAFVLLRLTGHLDPEGRAAALKALEVLTRSSGPADELATMRHDLLTYTDERP